MKTCHDCGHEHKVMASASQGDVQRYFCHANDHSCYNDNRGNYFGELDAVGINPRTPEGQLDYLLREIKVHAQANRRDPDRIDPFLEKLREYWTMFPDLRFGQMIHVLGLDSFNREDNDSLDLIDNRIRWSKEQQNGSD